MASAKLITLFIATCLLTVNCKPIKKRQSWYSGCGSQHIAPLPAIIADRAEYAPLPERYAEEAMPIGKPLPAFGYEFTVPAAPAAPAAPIYRGCGHTETLHIPPPPSPPAALPTPCLEAPALPLPPPIPPAEMPLPASVHTEPCLNTAPIPAPIFTEPAALPPPPPSQIMMEPLKTPGCIEAAPLPPAEIEIAPLPPQATFTDPCHGAAPLPAKFSFPHQSLGMTHYGGAMAAGEGYPEILDAKH